MYHCLSNGSAAFVEYCCKKKFIFSHLHDEYPLLQVEANAILDCLTEKTLPEENRPAPPPPPPPRNGHPKNFSTTQHGMPTDLKGFRIPKALTLIKNIAGTASELVTSCISQLQLMPARSLVRVGYPGKKRCLALERIMDMSCTKPGDPVRSTEHAWELVAPTAITSWGVHLTPPASPKKEKTHSVLFDGQTSLCAVLSDLHAGGDTPSDSVESVLLCEKEKVAEMTFIRWVFSLKLFQKLITVLMHFSGGDGLDAVLTAVDNLVKHGYPIRERPEDLLKASRDTVLVFII